MPATLNILRVSKRGLPLLLILSEESNNYRHQFEAHVAFPEKPGAGELVETAASIRILVGEDDNGKAVAVARQVVREAALLHGYGLQASDPFPVDAVVIEKVRDVSVSAWLAMGFFPGLVRPVNLNDEILSKLRSLGTVYDFAEYARRPR